MCSDINSSISYYENGIAYLLLTCDLGSLTQKVECIAAWDGFVSNSSGMYAFETDSASSETENLEL